MEAFAFAPFHISWIDLGGRLGAASFFALVIGVERFLRRKPVDFRPFVIVSLASCALIIGLVEASYTIPDPRLSIDPGKVISGVMTGVGFLGAGALFREEHVVQGAGSAAAIWAAGAIGIVCGLGLLWLGAILAGAMLALFLIGRPFTDAYDARLDESGSKDEES